MITVDAYVRLKGDVFNNAYTDSKLNVHDVAIMIEYVGFLGLFTGSGRFCASIFLF